MVQTSARAGYIWLSRCLWWGSKTVWVTERKDLIGNPSWFPPHNLAVWAMWFAHETETEIWKLSYSQGSTKVFQIVSLLCFIPACILVSSDLLYLFATVQEAAGTASGFTCSVVLLLPPFLLVEAPPSFEPSRISGRCFMKLDPPCLWFGEGSI